MSHSYGSTLRTMICCTVVLGVLSSSTAAASPTIGSDWAPGSTQGADPLAHPSSQPPPSSRRRILQAPSVSSLNFTTFASAADGRCLTVLSGNLTTGGQLGMAPCVPGSLAQAFSVPQPAVTMQVYVGGSNTLCVQQQNGSVQALPCRYDTGGSGWLIDGLGRLRMITRTNLCVDWTTDNATIDTCNSSTTNQTLAGINMQPWVGSQVEVRNQQTGSCLTPTLPWSPLGSQLAVDGCRPGVETWQRWEFLGDGTIRPNFNTSLCATTTIGYPPDIRLCNASVTGQYWFRDDMHQIRALYNPNWALSPYFPSQVSSAVQVTDATTLYTSTVWQLTAGATLSPSPPPPKKTVGLLGGPLKVMGVGSGMPSTTAAANINNSAPVQLLISGGLTLTGSPLELQLQPGLSLSQRTLNWVYQAASSTFTTTVDLSWNVSAVAASVGAPSSPTDMTLECVLTARLGLSSKAYPGPGFSGRYMVQGTLSITPNPWVYFGLTQPVLTANSTSPAPGGRRLAGHRRLQQAGSGLAAQLAGGWLQVVEQNPAGASAGADAGRGDGTAWVDAAGQVTLTGSNIPSSMVPPWKETGLESIPPAQPSNTWPPWAWALIGFGGVAVCNILVVICWLVVSRMVARRKQLQNSAEEEVRCVVTPTRPSSRDDASPLDTKRSGRRGVSPVQVSPVDKPPRRPRRLLPPTEVTAEADDRPADAALSAADSAQA